MNNALFSLMLTQFRQYFREPQILFWSFGFPLLLVWLLGVSFSMQDIPERHIGILLPQDAGQQAQIRAWGQTLTEKPHEIASIANRSEVKRENTVKIKYTVNYYQDYNDIILALKRGDIQIIVETLTDQDQTQRRLYYLDPQNSEAMLTYYLLNESEQALGQAVAQNLSVLDTPGLRYIDFLVPGLLAMAIMETCLIAVGWALVEKRITRVTRQMCITPMNPSLFLLAHILSCFIINFIEILIIYWFAKIYFDVSIQGQFGAFLLLNLAGNLCFSGIAVLAASRAKKAQTANGLLEVIILVQVLVSGIFFSYKNFPGAAFIDLLPLTMLANMMRRVFIEGADVVAVLPAAAALSAIGLVSFLVGKRIFRWY
ncbi:ABC transporter permease [Dickeya solani]|uniref:ABC transporter permease n=2 Tax=Dickeya solani TaxID=1089444 RepID=A0AAP3G6W5_9GAMM|nr:ABC transporter permease [Dickeya solani]ANE76731.1 ABC transporter [Dickeya solani IPO 2222]AUH07857.1 ABC transporter [Dickeya solani D s0432-1]AUH11880.1 ABC transporter [Dickeya solani]AYQ47248.1 ABC-2 family transporter protein [Dickeya solani]AYQ51420.1 ABC-2 family transporter protein [Dickeya solani]